MPTDIKVPPAPEMKFNLRKDFLAETEGQDDLHAAMARHTQEAIDLYRLRLWPIFYLAYHRASGTKAARRKRVKLFQQQQRKLMNCCYHLRHYLFTGDLGRVVECYFKINDIICFESENFDEPLVEKVYAEIDQWQKHDIVGDYLKVVVE